jgi:hypothetical protein
MVVPFLNSVLSSGGWIRSWSNKSRILALRRFYHCCRVWLESQIFHFLAARWLTTFHRRCPHTYGIASRTDGMKSIFTIQTFFPIHISRSLGLYDERGESPVTQDVQHAENKHVQERTRVCVRAEQHGGMWLLQGMQLLYSYTVHNVSCSEFHSTVASYISNKLCALPVFHFLLASCYVGRERNRFRKP